MMCPTKTKEMNDAIIHTSAPISYRTTLPPKFQQTAGSLGPADPTATLLRRLRPIQKPSSRTPQRQNRATSTPAPPPSPPLLAPQEAPALPHPPPPAAMATELAYA